MTIWIFTLLLFVGVGALGRQIGGIRMGISLVGVLVALFAAGPLAPLVRTGLAAVGFKNPILIWSLAAPLTFLGIVMVFNSIAVAVYLKVGGYYKHRAPDDVRMRWERVDAGLGVAAGLLAAVVYLLAGSAYLYHFGYYTKQVESPTDNPMWLKMVNKLRTDLSSTGFDRAAAGVTQASPEFFQTADAIGLIYHNPELQARLPEYPLFMSLAENGEFLTAFTNETFAVLLPARTNISLILKDPVAAPIITHPETKRIAQELDPADLIGFLKTGKSEKYAKEPMIGLWQIDLNGTLRQFAKAHPKATQYDLTRLRGLLRILIADYTLTTTSDEKAFVKGRRDLVNLGAAMLPGFRYSQLDTNTPLKTVAAGTWKKEGDKYEFTLADKTAAANLENRKVTATLGVNSLVFSRFD